MSQLGTYEVLFELASGGMGTVELAVGRGAFGVERLVAIKRIRSHLTETTEVVSRFLDEARIISQLHHANVVGLHQASEDSRGYYLVFDYVEGETLSGLIDLATIRDERVPLPIVIRVILDGLNGLNAAHEAKSANGEPLHILHRDVSKQNLIVGTDGVTRLSDFGISKSTLHSTITSQSYLAGKLIYMAPEYLSRAPVDRRMDIYAMGVTLWTAIAGREPWPEEGEAHTMTHILTDGVPTLSAAGVAVAPEIENIVTRAC
jgi:serine/threonine protein kinase